MSVFARRKKFDPKIQTLLEKSNLDKPVYVKVISIKDGIVTTSQMFLDLDSIPFIDQAVREYAQAEFDEKYESVSANDIPKNVRSSGNKKCC